MLCNMMCDVRGGILHHFNDKMNNIFLALIVVKTENVVCTCGASSSKKGHPRRMNQIHYSPLGWDIIENLWRIQS